MYVYKKSPERQAGGNDSLDSLKCFKCREGYVKPPIIPCKKGHLLCSECSGSRHCSLCRKKFQKTRCTELEAMAENMLKPCQWGCEKWMPPDEIEAHQKHCDLKKFFCMDLVGYGNCDWGGTGEEITQHLFRKHSSIISESFVYNFEIKDYSQVEQFSATRLLTCFSHLFLAKLKYCSANRAFYGRVYFLSGTPKVATGFRYEFEIGKATESNACHYKFTFSRQTHSISEYYSDNSFSDICDQFWFTKDIGNFFTDINDALTVTVIMESVQSLAMKNIKALKRYGFVPSQYCQKCFESFNPVPPK
jgi:hypothetical protein